MVERDIVVAALLLASSGAVAAPYLVSDPAARTDITHCTIYLDATARQVAPVAKDGTGKPYCSFDLAGIANGTHSATAAFVIQDAAWGEVEGPKSVPFVFTRPAPPSSPSGLTVRRSE